VVFATQLLIQEILRIREEPVSMEELESAKRSRLKSFPARFSAPASTLRAFSNLEMDGFPLDFYDKWQERYQAVTVDDVHQAAQRNLHPEDLIILIAGDIERIQVGADLTDANQPAIEASASAFGGRTLSDLAQGFGDGKVHVFSFPPPSRNSPNLEG
jgi:hypothetical protein